MKKYTTKEASEVLGVNIRTIQRHVATLSDELSKSNNKKGVLIPEDVLKTGSLTTLKRYHNDTKNFRM